MVMQIARKPVVPVIRLVVVLLAMSCLTAATAADDAATHKGWTLQFSDDFNRDTLHAGEIDLNPPDWQVLSGKWRIEKGMLRGESDAGIALLRRFPGDQRLEFDAVAHDNIGDLTGILGTSERGSYLSGYFFGFGSNNNTVSKLLVKLREVKRSDARIVPGKLHHIICQREGNVLTHIVDGKVIATYNDDQPLVGPGHDVVGFYVFGAGNIDNVRVYTKGAGARATAERIMAPSSRSLQPIQSLPDLVPDPLFEELFSDTPGPTRFFAYSTKYEGGLTRKGSLPRYRATARRFGFRWVLDEQLDEAPRYNLILHEKMSEPEYKKRGIATVDLPVVRPLAEGEVSTPDGTVPAVFGKGAGMVWIMDPRYLEHMVRGIAERAESRDYWGIHMFDELWTYYVIKPVPKDKWYKQVEDADKEIREKYGFGKYGMPESFEDGDPFDRIAHGRWASDKLTETFAKMYKAAKAINPDMKIIAHTHGSAGDSCDIEAWAPYFDIMGGQCSMGATSAFFDSVRVGAVTKLDTDLAGKPSWMMVHTAVQHAARREPEDIREMYSQVFRNGGGGLWLMAAEWFEAELIDPMFAEPAKWRAMLALRESISKMRLPRLPKPDCAILFSSDSSLATPWGAGFYDTNDRIISAYAVLGPLLRSWFHFVSDRQIERGTRKLSDYKVLYVPFAAYERASVVEKIGEYAKAGGTVVCTDPQTFTWNIDGEGHGERWENLSGIRKGSRRKAVSTYVTSAPNPFPLAAPLSMRSIEPGWNIVPVNKKVQVLAAYEDGSPAITLNPYGKGRVIFFAADPFVASGYIPIPEPFFSLAHKADKESLVGPGTPIVKFIEAIQKSVGVQMGRDIWRFKLPPFSEDPWQKETGLCLTNNYVFDVNEPLLEPNNVQTGGTYVYSRLPTGIADVGQPGAPIPFNEGKLTNRLKAYETRQKTGHPSFQTTPEWVVSWTDPAPVSITFDLRKEYPLKKLRFVYSGTMPALEVSGSRDGNAWKKFAAAPEETAGEDVKDVALGLEGSYRYVKLGFATRTVGEAFELCEVEIWGKSSK